PIQISLAELSSNRGVGAPPTHHYKTPCYALSNRIETLSTSAGRAFVHGRRGASCDLLSLLHRNEGVDLLRDERIAIGLSLLVDQSASTFFVAVSKISGVDARCRSPRKIGWMQL
ncbi:unnamed protein product, partial [Musa banksii]